MPSPIALITHPACAGHDTGVDHAESQDRLRALLEAVHGDAELRAVLREELAGPAREEDLLRVHTPEHVARIRAAVAEAARQDGRVWLDADTPVSPASWDAALAAAGCAITAAEAVLDGAVPTAFALSRPPGHHATAGAAMGFCLVNNAAVAIRRVQAQGRVERVLVLDWDAHHGNGTQEIFDEDPTVYVLSLHLSPDYPGTGASSDRGAAAGRGTTRNVPLPHGTTAAEYRRRHLEALDAAFGSFAPDLVVVSAGLDGLAGDPQGGFLLEPRDLHRVTADLLDRLPASAKGRVVAVLEGGYALERIGSGLVNVLRALARLPPADDATA